MEYLGVFFLTIEVCWVCLNITNQVIHIQNMLFSYISLDFFLKVSNFDISLLLPVFFAFAWVIFPANLPSYLRCSPGNWRGERGGSVVECRTPEREVRGSRPTSAVLCPWARHFTPRKYWLITQEAMAPSRHDWKIVDWDVKPQHNQPGNWRDWPASFQ